MSTSSGHYTQAGTGVTTLPGQHVRIAEMDLDRHVADLHTVGYTIVEDAAPPQLFARLRSAIIRISEELRDRGVTPFNFGPETSMVYRLLAQDHVFLDAAMTPKLTALMSHLLGEGYVANATTGSMLHQGAKPGPLHADNQFFPEPFPVQIHVATAIWCLDDFTCDLGSTHIVPKSHQRCRHPRQGEGLDEVVALEAQKGSIALWTGHTWHRSGGRTSPGTRVALHTAFSRPHIQRFEAYTPDELERMINYDDGVRSIVGADLPYDFIGDGPRFDQTPRPGSHHACPKLADS